MYEKRYFYLDFNFIQPWNVLHELRVNEYFFEWISGNSTEE
jgi:hypothetical protein